jgi:hypothetical protein
MAQRRRPRDPGEPRGTVHPLLDLHGLTGDEALRRAAGWLRARAAAGERTVVIVTGRGTHSRGLPVLRPEIEHLLEGLRGSTVEAWEPTQGEGGFRVRLRPPPPAAGSASAAAEAAALARQHPPELRRRAEESLAELGITPTPALLRAEIRRIAAEDEGGEPRS